MSLCCSGGVRYVVYVRDTVRNLPAKQGTATTMVLACDCSSGAHIAQAISSGGENAEAKGPATNVRQFARFAQQRGMVEGVHWAIDPRPGVQRLMQLAFPHHGSPNTPKAPAALEELERMAGLGPPERQAEEQYGVQERGAEPPLEPPPAPVERFDAEDWRDNHPAWMDGDFA